MALFCTEEPSSQPKADKTTNLTDFAVKVEAVCVLTFILAATDKSISSVC